MKKINFSNLENKYYYTINRYFWHLLIGISILIILAGIGVLLWSYVPPHERKVVKPQPPTKEAYPEISEVKIENILKKLPVEKNKQENNKTEDTMIMPEPEFNAEENNKPKIIDSLALSNFYDQITKTKELIPFAENQSFWNNQYITYFASESDRKLFRKTKNPSFKKAKLTKKGFTERFIDFTDAKKRTDYADKEKILKSVNTLLESLADVESRINFIENYFFYIPLNRYKVNQIEERFSKIAKVLQNLPSKNQLNAYYYIWRFINKNPKDGLNMIDYQSEIIPKFSYASREAVIKKMHREYYNYYNNNLNALIESTNGFIKLLPKLPIDGTQAHALSIYYNEYRKNNQLRNKRIREIDKAYEHAVQKWEKNYNDELRKAKMEYISKLDTREKYRFWSIKGIFGSFITVLFLSVIVLVISMIRNVNRLTEAIYENNKIFLENMSSDKSEQ